MTNSTAPAKEAKPEESKGDKFKRLGITRTKNALKAISGIGNLTGANYESTPEQRAAIVSALRKEVDTVEAMLEGKKVADGGFTL